MQGRVRGWIQRVHPQLQGRVQGGVPGARPLNPGNNEIQGRVRGWIQKGPEGPLSKSQSFDLPSYSVQQAQNAFLLHAYFDVEMFH